MITLKFVTSLIFLYIHISAGDELNVDEAIIPDEKGKSFCLNLLESYANASASFIYCAVRNARPIKICERCYISYQNVTRAHNEILQVEDGSGNKKCKEQLMNLDRLEIIEEGFHYISDLWDRAACDNCFDLKNETFHVRNSTLQFFNIYNSTFQCFANYNLGNDTYKKTVCAGCEKTYCDMNKFYDGLKNSQENICMDIVDTMNVTRMLWNDVLHCKTEKPRLDIIYLATSCIFAALPVLFYLSAGLFTTVIRNRLQMQKRLAELLRPSTSSDL